MASRLWQEQQFYMEAIQVELLGQQQFSGWFKRTKISADRTNY